MTCIIGREPSPEVYTEAMAHQDRKKKGGVRKDKKTARMRDDLAERKENAGEPKPTHDQVDIQTFKPGHASDRTTRPQNRPR